MANLISYTKYRRIMPNKLYIVTGIGFLLRLAMLIFILTIGLDYSDPYFIADDIKYESLAQEYMLNASTNFDIRALDKITEGYLQMFWPYVVCISSYIFKSIYASRFINISLSTLCIPVIYKITELISNDKKTSLRAAMLFAFLPVTILTSCFPIKDIFLTFAVMFVFYFFLQIQNGKNISIPKIAVTVLLLVCIYLTRGAVTEMLLIFFAVYFIQRFIKKKNYTAATIGVILVVIAFFIFKDSLLSAFDTKITDYSGYADKGEGIQMVKINNITQIYKLPFTYFFASLQPIKLNLFAASSSGLWMSVIAYSNITMYPIAIGNFIYIIMKKKNFFFWLSTFIIYSAVIILSIGIFRHYLFLLPVQMINYSLYVERDRTNNIIISLVGSALFFLLIFFISI